MTANGGLKLKVTAQPPRCRPASRLFRYLPFARIIRLITYDATGQALTGTDATGSGSSATYTAVTNNAAAAVGTPMAGSADVQNSHSVTQAAGSVLSSSYGYNSALSLVSSTMPNGAAASQVFSPSTGLLTSNQACPYTGRPRVIRMLSIRRW